MVAELVGIIDGELHHCTVVRISASAEVTVAVTYEGLHCSVRETVVKVICPLVLLVVCSVVVVTVESLHIESLYSRNVPCESEGTVEILSLFLTITGEVAVDCCNWVLAFEEF